MTQMRVAALLLILAPAAAVAAVVSPPTSAERGVVIGRVVVRDQRPALARSWSRVTVIGQGPSGQVHRAEVDHDGVFVLADVEPGEHVLTRLMLVRQTAGGGDSLSLSFPSPWRVVAARGAVTIIGELTATIGGNRVLALSVSPLAPPAEAMALGRLAGTAWTERPLVVHAPPTDRPAATEAPREARSQVFGPDHVVLPYQGAGRSIVVDAAINGRVGRFLLDTGASVTVISKRLAREAEASIHPGAAGVTLHTANGPVAAPLTMLASVRVAGVEVHQVMAAIHDLPGVGGGIDGLLGMTFLRHFRVTIDPERRVLILDRFEVAAGEPAARRAR